MEFVDFMKRVRSPDVGLIFPGWRSTPRGSEQVAFLSPHDDDIVLGAGYLLTAVIKNGGTPYVIIFCKGDAGYSTPKEKRTVVQRRKKETIECYEKLGVLRKNISFLNIPDFSLMTYVNRQLPRSKGLFEYLLRLLRKNNITRIVFSSGHFEHWDHTAVYYMGMYSAPQAGDPVLVDLGKSPPVKSYLIYSVWGEFESVAGGISADKGIVVDAGVENTVRQAIGSFKSQGAIIEGIIARRENRLSALGYLELYKTAEVRKEIDWRPYHELISAMTK